MCVLYIYEVLSYGYFLQLHTMVVTAVRRPLHNKSMIKK